jgi:hypothetical protein
MLANAMEKSKTSMKKPAAFGCGFLFGAAGRN